MLHTFSQWLEDFSNRHSHIIALLEAVSTSAAVIVALWASYTAKRASLPRLSAQVSVMLIIHGDGRPKENIPRYIAVKLTNKGSGAIKLNSTCFSWRLPFTKQAWLALPLDENGDGIVTVRRYPLIILPRTSETIFLTSLQTFREYVPGILNSGKFGRKISARLLRGYVYADDGSPFRASLEGSFWKELASIIHEPPSQLP